MRKYLSGKAEPTRPKMLAIARASNVSVQWLATGEGPMRPGEGTPAPGTLVHLPFHEVSRSGGDGRAFEAMAFDAGWLIERLGIPHDQLKVFEVERDDIRGFRPGDWVVIDTSRERVTYETAYLVKLGPPMLVCARAVVDRVVITYDLPGRDVLDLDEQERKRRDFQVLGRAVLHIRRP